MNYLNLLRELEKDHWVGLTGAGAEWVCQAILPHSDRVLHLARSSTPEGAIRALYLLVFPIPKSENTGKLRRS